MSRQGELSAAPEAPRFALAWAALVYALCALALGWPALGGGFLVSPSSDQYIAGYAFREFGAEHLRATGGFPLWNPYLMGGVPFVAGMGGDVFYPTFLLRLLVGTDTGMTWSFILHVFLAGLFSYGFLRALGLGFFGALLGGVAYMLSGPIVSLVSPGHDGKLYVGTMLPLTLWMVVRGVRDGRAWAWGVLALTIGLAVLSPHPQLLQYMLLAAGFFGLYLAFAKHGGVALDRRVALGRLGLAAAAVLAGFLVGAIQYMPVFEYVDWSPRAGGRGIEYSASFSKPPFEILGTIIADFAGVLDTYWGGNFPIKLHGEYLGAAVLFLAGAAYAGSHQRRALVWFWTGVLIVAVLWAIGLATPFFRLVYLLVPGTRFFRAPDNMFMVVAMSVAVLAAIGTERIFSRGVGRGYLIGWGIAAVLILLIGTPGVYSSLAESFAEYPQALASVGEAQRAVLLNALQSFAVLGATIFGVLAYSRGRVSSRALGWGLVALAALDLWVVERRFWRFSAPAEVVYASDPTIDYIKSQERPGRVLALGLQGAPIAPHDPFLGGDALMVHEVRQALGYHGNELGRYQRIGGKNENWRNVTNPNFLQLYNIRWLLTNLPDLDLPGGRLVAGPARNAAGTMVYLYELGGEHPAAWVAPAMVEAPDPVVLETLLDPRYDDVRRVALFDTSATVIAEELTALPDPLPIDASVTTYEPGHIVVELSEEAPAGAALVVSENYYPGWMATVDGEPARTERVNYTLIGVPLEAGARAIELRFESEPYEAGKTITLVMLTLIALAIGGGVLLDRRRRG